MLDAARDLYGLPPAEFTAARRPDVHLMLAGPAVAGVSDDPEGGAVLADGQIALIVDCDALTIAAPSQDVAA